MPAASDHIHATICDAEIKLSVGTKLQTVHIVAARRDVNTKAVSERFPKVSHPIRVRIAQKPKVRNAREINVALPREHAGGNTGNKCPKIFCKGNSFVSAPVPIFIDDEPEPI